MALPATAAWQTIAQCHAIPGLLTLSRNSFSEHLGNGMHVGVCAAVLLIAALFVNIGTPFTEMPVRMFREIFKRGSK